VGLSGRARDYRADLHRAVRPVSADRLVVAVDSTSSRAFRGVESIT
jgi:hypothetical protein